MKAFFSRVPLQRRLTVTIAVVTAMALLLSSAAFIAYDRVSTGEAMVRRLSAEAEIVGFNSASAILFGDHDSAATTLAALRAEAPVVSAALYDAGESCSPPTSATSTRPTRRRGWRPTRPPPSPWTPAG